MSTGTRPTVRAAVVAAGVYLAAVTACRTVESGAARREPTFVADQSAGRVSRPLQDFVVSVETLPATFEPSGRALVSTLRRLAAAVEDMSSDPESRRRSTRLESLADELASSADAWKSTRIARAALSEGVEAVEASASGDAARAQVERARRAIDEVDRDRALPAQAPAVRRVLAEVANGLLVARGAAPAVVVGAQARTDGSRAGPTASPADLELAREASSRVARLADLDGRDARVGSAEALEAFARALARPGEEKDELARLLSEIRFQARRLRTAETTFESGSWVRAGLLATVEALARRPGGEAAGAGPWVTRARAAVLGIDPDQWFAFQRARIQEAYRSVADALLVAAEVGGASVAGAE